MVNFNKIYNSFTSSIGKNNNQKKINEYFEPSSKTTTTSTIQASYFYTEQVDSIPTETYQELSRASGRGRKSDEATSIGLHNSLCSILVKEKASHRAVGMVRLVGDGGTFCAVVGLCVMPVHRLVTKINNNENGNASGRKTIVPTLPALVTSSLAVIAATATGNTLNNHSNTTTSGVSGANSGTPTTSLATAVTSSNNKPNTSNTTKKSAEDDEYVLERLLLQELQEYINDNIPATCYVAIIASNRSRRIFEEFGFIHQDMVNQFGMFLKK